MSMYTTLLGILDANSKGSSQYINPCSAEYLRLFFAPQLNI